MIPAVGKPFFFETEHRFEEGRSARRHPHYGRFLELIPGRRVRISWVTGAGGTDGAETIVTVDLEANGDGTTLRLSHEGFATDSACKGHLEAWPMVLSHMERKVLDSVVQSPRAARREP